MSFLLPGRFSTLHLPWVILDAEGGRAYQLTGQFGTSGEALAFGTASGGVLGQVVQHRMEDDPLVEVILGGRSAGLLERQGHWMGGGLAVALRGSSLTLEGNLYARQYVLRSGGETLARMDAQVFGIPSHYGVEVQDADAIHLALCVAAAVDLACLGLRPWSIFR